MSTAVIVTLKAVPAVCAPIAVILNAVAASGATVKLAEVPVAVAPLWITVRAMVWAS